MSALEQLVAERLEDYHATLFGRAFDLSQSESREAAVEWLASEVRAVMGAADILLFDGTRWWLTERIGPDQGAAWSVERVE